MRISDWSSDVCSSDLAVDPDNRLVARTLERDWECALSAEQALRDEQQRALAEEPEHLTDADREAIRQLAQNIPALWRSEEHTSELQSLMRISYAVFCLKKKNKQP